MIPVTLDKPVDRTTTRFMVGTRNNRFRMLFVLLGISIDPGTVSAERSNDGYKTLGSCYNVYGQKYRIIDSCIDRNSSQLIRLCEDLHTNVYITNWESAANIVRFVPFTDLEKDITYRNIYCAMCNGSPMENAWSYFNEKEQTLGPDGQKSGIKAHNTDESTDADDSETGGNYTEAAPSPNLWNFKVLCNDDFLKRIQNTPQADVFSDTVWLSKQFQEHCFNPGVYPGDRLQSKMRVCPHDGDPVEDTLRGFQQIQSGGLPRNMVKENVYFRGLGATDDEFDNAFWKPPSMSVLITFNEDGVSEIVYKNNQNEVIHISHEKCDAGEIYDVFAQACRSLFCPVGEVPSDNGCSKPPANFLMNVEISVVRSGQIKWPWPILTAVIQVLKDYCMFTFDVKPVDIKNETLSEDRVTLEMNVYRNPGYEAKDSDLNPEKVMDRLMEFLAEFLAFYKVPKINEVDVRITVAPSSTLLGCPEGRTERMGVDSKYYRLNNTDELNEYIVDITDESTLTVHYDQIFENSPDFQDNIDPQDFTIKSRTFTSGQFSLLSYRSTIVLSTTQEFGITVDSDERSDKAQSHGRRHIRPWRNVTTTAAVYLGFEKGSQAMICMQDGTLPENSLDCMTTSFNSTEVEQIPNEYGNDTSLLMLNSGMVIPSEYWQYAPALDRYFVCVYYLLTYDTTSTSLKVEIFTWVTLILSCSSVIAMVITLALYYTQDQLATDKGVCIRSLSLAILLSIAFFEFLSPITEPEELCYATTVGTHYLFLTSVFWNSVMAFDVWRSFACGVIPRFERLQERVNAAGSRLVWYYRAVAWLTPLGIVSICCVIDLSSDINIYTHEAQVSKFYYNQSEIEPSTPVPGPAPFMDDIPTTPAPLPPAPLYDVPSTTSPLDMTAAPLHNYLASILLTNRQFDIQSGNGHLVSTSDPPTETATPKDTDVSAGEVRDKRSSGDAVIAFDVVQPTQICFIDNQKAKIWAFMFPVFLLAASNFLVLILTLYRLHTGSSNTSGGISFRRHVITNRHGKALTRTSSDGAMGSRWERTLIYVKLMTLTGITWTIGLIAAFTNDAIIKSIFGIMLSSQGLFIFFSFVWRNFWALLRDWWRMNVSWS